MTLMAEVIRVRSHTPIEIAIGSGPTRVTIRTSGGLVEWQRSEGTNPHDQRSRAPEQSLPRSPLGTPPEKLRARAQRFGESSLAQARRHLDRDLETYFLRDPQHARERLDLDLEEFTRGRPSPRGIDDD
jgi:hypothetical protein